MSQRCAYLDYIVINYLYLLQIRVVAGMQKGEPWEIKGNRFMETTLPPVQTDTAAVALPLQMKNLRSLHLGVGVASAQSSVS